MNDLKSCLGWFPDLFCFLFHKACRLSPYMTTNYMYVCKYFDFQTKNGNYPYFKDRLVFIFLMFLYA